MLISRRWLASHFEGDIPDSKKIAELFNALSMEVEGIEEKNGDEVIDIKVLPDRAHDALSHRGIARELGVLIDKKPKEEKLTDVSVEESLSKKLFVRVEDEKLCHRYSGRLVEGIQVTSSPAWLSERLVVVGQRSINNIVDITNYVMLEIGQPMHAFDADKVEGDIIVRHAHRDEHITTLDGKDVELPLGTLVIADEKGALAIAGVKGGKKAEVDENTKNIILEAANFDSVSTRKTARKVNIQTDSSKRFENEITTEFVAEGMTLASSLVKEFAGGGSFGPVVDVYPHRMNLYKVGFSREKISRLLGVDISDEEIGKILNRFGFVYEIVDPIKKVLEIAPTLMDAKYEYGASVLGDAPKAFDCSSFIAYLYVQGGVAIPRMVIDQYVYGKEISKEDARPGDLVFSNTGVTTRVTREESVEFFPGTKVSGGVDHLGLYMGEGRVMHFAESNGKGAIEKIEESERFKNIVGYRRMTEEKTRYVVTIPAERLDLRIEEDFVEEVGRIYGYDRIPVQQVSELGEFKAQVNKRFYWENKIRAMLVEKGFSEIYTYAFDEKGEVKIANPLALDRPYLNNNLSSYMRKSLELAGRNMPLLAAANAKIFEIATVFGKEGEHVSLAIGWKGSKADIKLAEITEALEDELDAIFAIEKEGKDTAWTEVNFTELISHLDVPDTYENSLTDDERDIVYRKISLYPFIARDIAIFVPPNTKEEEVSEILRTEGGELLRVGPTLFDRYEKKNKDTGEVESVSYAMNMVFQSDDRTLTDEEVGAIMQSITDKLNSHEGWQVR